MGNEKFWKCKNYNCQGFDIVDDILLNGYKIYFDSGCICRQMMIKKKNRKKMNCVVYMYI